MIAVAPVQRWPVKPLKYVAAINRSKLSEDTPPDWPLQYVDISSVDGDGAEPVAQELAFGEAPSRARMIVNPGDTIISTVRTYLRAVAHFERPGPNLICSTGFAVLSPAYDLDPRFFYYWVRSDWFVDEVVARSVGVSYPAVRPSEIASMPVPTPAASEQRAIADFLDRETGRFDALVEKKRRLIELLEEQIERRVDLLVLPSIDGGSRRLPTDVPLEHEYPPRWRSVPLGHLLKRITYGFTNPMPTADDGPFMLTANDVQDGHIAYESARRTEIDAYRTLLTDKSRPRSGDVLVTKDGTLGRVAVFDGRPACINQSVALLRPRTEAVLPELLAELLRASPYREAMLFDAGGTTIKHLYISRMTKLRLALPPLKEQRELLKRIRAERERVSSLVRRLRKQLDLIAEYRRALITAAVTGQIDVDVEAPDPEKALA